MPTYLAQLLVHVGRLSSAGVVIPGLEDLHILVVARYAKGCWSSMQVYAGSDAAKGRSGLPGALAQQHAQRMGLFVADFR